ncbi:polysaccharide biosynthesis protein [Gordonia sp. NPDC003429]
MVTPVPGASSPRPARDGVVGALGWVALGSMVANVCAYAVHVAAGRWWLTPAEYGEFAVLLSAMLVLAVPALALQAVVAREVVHGHDGAGLRRLTARCAVAVVGLVVVAVPVMAAVASTGIAVTVAGLAAAPFLTVIGGGQGILQGRNEFRLLAWVLAAVGVLRTAPVLVVLGLGFGPAGGLAAGSFGAAAAALLVWAAVAVSDRRRPERAGSDALSVSAGLGTVLRASQVQLVLVVAASLDLLLARSALEPRAAGVYAFGAIATKVAFWLPQAVGVVFYPRLADPAISRASFRQAVTVVAAIGAVLTALGVVGGPLVPILIGADYRGLTWVLGLFAYTGSALAVLQVGLLSAIARDRTAVSVAVWAVLVAEAAAIGWLADSVVSLAVIAAVAATVSALITTTVGLRAPDRGPGAAATSAATHPER